MMLSREISHLMRTLPRSLIDKLIPELERVRIQARTIGLEEEFELAWSYEKERARVTPGQRLNPKQILQIVVSIA